MTALEKMAAALKEALPDYVGDWDDENPDPCVARYVDCGEVDFRVLARAALMAIREPSEGMAEVAEEWWELPIKEAPQGEFFTVLIDHILNGGE